MENSKNGILHDVQDDRYFIFNFQLPIITFLKSIFSELTMDFSTLTMNMSDVTTDFMGLSS